MRDESEKLLNWLGMAKASGLIQFHPELDKLQKELRAAVDRSDRLVLTATAETSKFVKFLPDEPDGPDGWCGRAHGESMVGKILRGEVRGTKAHRWLGWLQAAVYMFGGIEAKKLMEINKKAQELT